MMPKFPKFLIYVWLISKIWLIVYFGVRVKNVYQLSTFTSIINSSFHLVAFGRFEHYGFTQRSGSYMSEYKSNKSAPRKWNHYGDTWMV